MTDAYLEGQLNVSRQMMEAATDLSAKTAHKGLAKAYAARIKKRDASRALRPADNAPRD